MAGQTGPLSRAEARAQTREDVFEAAESLFLTAGYQATTVAQIAEKAGRTQGSIYSNFAGKEALGLEVIKRRYLAEFANLAVLLHQVGSLEEKLDAIAIWWEKLASQQELAILVAEYALATRRSDADPSAVTSYLELVQDTVTGIVWEYLGVEDDDDRLVEFVERATKAIIAAGTGLAVVQTAGLIDAHESSQLLTDAIRLWSAQVPGVGNQD